MGPLFRFAEMAKRPGREWHTPAAPCNVGAMSNKPIARMPPEVTLPRIEIWVNQDDEGGEVKR